MWCCHIPGAVFGSCGVSVAAVVTWCCIMLNGQMAASITRQNAAENRITVCCFWGLLFFPGSKPRDINSAFCYLVTYQQVRPWREWCQINHSRTLWSLKGTYYAKSTLFFHKRWQKSIPRDIACSYIQAPLVNRYTWIPQTCPGVHFCVFMSPLLL